MKKTIKASFAILGLAISASAFSFGDCSSNGYEPGSSPKGDEYLVVGVPAVFHIDGDHNYIGESSTFWTSANYLAVDDFNYQDFKWRAKESITFTERGPQWVTATDPVITAGPLSFGPAIFCNDVFVQDKPQLKIVSFSDGGATLTYNVDEFSKNARENKPINIVVSWVDQAIFTSGDATRVIGNLSGTITIPIPNLPRGHHTVQAYISDGALSETIYLGEINNGGHGGTVPCGKRFCNNPE